MRDRILGLLGLMRKANAAAIGETDTGAAVRGGKAKLLLLASDASDNAKKRAETFVYGRGVKITVLPFEKQEISAAVGKGGCSMLAVCDAGFAGALMKLLDEYDAQMRETSEQVEEE